MVFELKERKKKTRVVCTIGPASENEKMLRKLILAGMNVMRLNFSHGDFEEHGGRIVTVRKLSKELNKNIAILLLKILKVQVIVLQSLIKNYIKMLNLVVSF